jgi:hypothetical protein
MYTHRSSTSLVASLALTAASLATSANACSIPDYNQADTVAKIAAALGASAQPVVTGSSAAISPDSFGSRGAAAIVGLWKFTFTSKGNTAAGIPDGAPIDAGFQTWQSDGTEITNSSRPPLTSSFCLGAWEQEGYSTIKLNHFALSWDATGANLVGPANIREVLKVDRSGNTFAGTFTIDQYAQDGKTLLGHVGGTVAATRITVD